MLEALPPLIRTSAGPIPRSFIPCLHALREELAIPVLGASVIASRLCEVLLVQALRAHISDVSWNDRGWFRMLADPLLREQLGEASRPGATLPRWPRRWAGLASEPGRGSPSSAGPRRRP
jgi:hypothetical protein